MPNVAPPQYRRLYEIYPAKACLTEGDDFDQRLKETIAAMGRKVGTGRGDSPRYLAAACRGPVAALSSRRV